MEPTSKKKKCFNDGCNKKTSKIIGDCNYCNNKFCDKHRLPESHNCTKLDECCKLAKEQNEIKLYHKVSSFSGSIATGYFDSSNLTMNSAGLKY